MCNRLAPTENSIGRKRKQAPASAPWQRASKQVEQPALQRLAVDGHHGGGLARLGRPVSLGLLGAACAGWGIVYERGGHAPLHSKPN